MAVNLKNTIFERFYSIFDKREDANKNVEGKGTLERYNEVIGEDADDFIYPKIDGALDSLIIPRTMLDRYVVDRENSLGNDVLFLDFTPIMRKRILSHWHRYVNIKGTIRGYTVLFAMLGITATITETWDTGGFDSATTFDSTSRPTFDSGKCKSCSAYSIALVGPPLTSTIYSAILSIILFNEPINADLTGLTYNGYDLLNIVYGFTYETEIVGTHTPSFLNSGPTLFFDLAQGDPSGFILSNTPSWIYSLPGIKPVQVSVPDYTTVSGVDMTNQQIVNTIDFSLFIALQEWIFKGCPNLTNIIFPAHAVQVTKMQIVDTSCTVLDMSGLENLSGDIQISGAALTSWLLWPGAKSSFNTGNLSLKDTSITGAIDFEALLFILTTLIDISNNSAITDVRFGTTVQSSGAISFIDIQNNNALTSIEIDNLRMEILEFNFSNNPALATVNIGSGWGDRASETRVSGKNNPSLGGTLDLSTMPVGGYVDMSNSAITDILHTASFGSLSFYSVDSCPNLTYYDITPVNGILGEDFAQFDASDCGLTSGDVDSFLGDLVTICIANRGEVAPGSFTGRTVAIDGTNAAPTALGLGYITQLNNIGITVSHN